MEEAVVRLAAARAALSQAVGSSRKAKAGRQAGWEVDVPEGATHIGTARIRSQLSTAQRLIAQRNGSQPYPAGFDDVADNLDPPPIAGRPKYGNRKCEADGLKFDSERERSRYYDLKRLRSAGLIANLRMQVRFEIAPAVVIGGRRRAARYYVADFVYVKGGRQVIEDVKGMKTPVYSLKKHLMAACGLEIVEV
ncbi:DUF1064 domain-containing protein [Burkholderia sp. USMB20]|uniref:DUF1064 domain-containing protein n=1 Tax=Burkholderia sp. USMB20 TaxID=1571773 RepID=UPI0009E3E5B1|nr:DUF1064 domain-containing protein [Burkholderia sp. USMB20]TGN96108.1 DUF1064 domain-containing protein [Burkholderia sp. USMB20]